MKNPLRKRIFRELRHDIVKYAAVFIMMVILISMCSGMRVSNESLKKAYYDSFELYTLEDGHITFDRKLPEELEKELETEGNIKLYENIFIDDDVKDTDKTVRVFRMSDEINNSCLLSGNYPSADNEIVLDRVYAANNDLNTGDSICIGGKDYTITGLIALVQYSTLYENNTDSMFDTINFCVAEVTDDGFERLDSRKISWNYAWFYGESYSDDTEQAELSEKLMDVLEDTVTAYDENIIKKQTEELMKKQAESGGKYDISEYVPDKTDIVGVENYVPRYLNNSVTFAIGDIGKDETIMMIMCYMMIALIAFIFAVTISGTICSESAVIGTLRASGYSRGEITAHYMILPVAVTLVSAVVGNIIGYTVMKDFCAGMYLGSYSLTEYKTVWDSSAFLLSTVVPAVLMTIINYFTLYSKLKLSPLKFLKCDLKKNGNKKAVRLSTRIPFKTRFSIRILLTNLPGYTVMIIGIMFGAVLIAFGDMLPRLIDDMKQAVTDDMISSYQYILYDCEKAEEITGENVEKFALRSFDFSKKGFITDEIMVYGVEKNSRFVPAEIPEGRVLVSTGISEKYGIKTGDTLKLDEKYKKDTSYSLVSGGIYDYRASLAVFMNISDFNRVFGEKPDHFTGYFSDTELDTDPDNIATTMTLSDYTKLSDQINVSMGEMMNLFKYFGALFFIIVVYVLSRQIIERNFQPIALTKILGFRNSETGRLYIVSTTAAVIAGLAISVPVIDAAIHAIFKGYLYTMMAGYLPCSIRPVTYIIMIAAGLACYAIAIVLQMIKIAGVSKAAALKNAE